MIIETAQQKVLSFLFRFPTKGFTIREMSRQIKISHTRISSIIKGLVKKELVKLVKEKRQFKIFGNMENQQFLDLKRLYNLYSILELRDFLIKKLNPNLIVVYGSYSKGEDFENSDIDIFISPSISKEPDFGDFEKKIAREIHLFSEKWESIPKELKNNIINGIVLYGVLEC